MTTNNHTPLCGCGSCQDAVDAALRTVEQLLEHQCFHWLVAVVLIQAKIVQGIVDTDPEAALRAHLLSEFCEVHADEIGDRVEAIFEKGGHAAALN